MKRVLSAILDFLQLEAASSIVLLAAALAALALANSPLAPHYDAFLNLPLEVRVGAFEIAKPLLLWVNDGLMAIFFFLVGLEIKREVLQGELSTSSQIALPAIAAAGGMAVPALIYAALNIGDPVAARGWAIPAATDIAFTLGALALLGERVPQGLKVFLLTLAILDDLGAIVVIALFYTERLSLPALGVAAVAMAALALLNRRGVPRIAPYLLLGIVLWAAVLKSSVHATLAGVALAFFIPLRAAPGDAESPLERLERDLHPSVAFGVLPLFGFANAGVPLEGITLASLAQPVPAGIAAGLLLGKTAGVFGFAWLAVKLKLARLPEGVDWPLALGGAVLCGIGFTMSLFIASLAFPDEGSLIAVQSRLGILIGSCFSGALGFAILRWALGRIR